MLRTRSPRARLLYCYRKLRVRLACVKHAASVRSEPGSNSHVKLAVPKIKNPDSHRGQIFENELLMSLGSLMNQTGSGTYHPIVKEQYPLSSRKVCRQTQILQTYTPTVKRNTASNSSTDRIPLCGIPCANRAPHGFTAAVAIQIVVPFKAAKAVLQLT